MRLNCSIVAALLACQTVWLANSANAQENVKDKEGLSSFHIGNSLTNTTGKFAHFVRTAGIIHKYDSFTAGGAWFRYTLDGTAPTRTLGYVYCGVVNVPAGAPLNAIAYKSGMADSAVAEMK